jgi:carbonic anhydrase/acetyltransferase-like protein (isoleucine patch superfamily)
MLLEHQGKRPNVHDTAYVAPNATLCGAVTVGAGSRVMFGAVLTAEGGPVEIGANCVVMENAVVRGTGKHPTAVGDNVVVGPRAHLVGCRVGDNAFLATGATVFNGASIGAGAEVRVNGTVHLRTSLPPDAVVPEKRGFVIRDLLADAIDGTASFQRELGAEDACAIVQDNTRTS